jgi:diguanylate cyclase (GGDEF)-like protein
MNAMRSRGGHTERILAEQVLRENAGYVAGSQALFDAADAHDSREQIQAVDSTQVDPVFSRLEQQVSQAAAAHHARAVAAVNEANGTATAVVVTDVMTLLVAMTAFGVVGSRIRRTQKDLRRRGALSAHQARHDPLTGLPNRTLLFEAAAEALAHPTNSNRTVSLFLLDLDRFKEVNDTLGHQAGDELLRQAGRRLAGAVRDSDLVARLGGDEFVILTIQDTADAAAATAQRLTDVLQETFVVLDVALEIEASIGIAQASGASTDVQQLMQHADVAMYQAKASHRAYAFYDAACDHHTPDRLTLLGDLRRALSREEELFLVYQPKVATDTEQVCGVEALLRWQHPSRGLVPPDQFIPTVETTGLIDELTFYVLRRALQQLQRWYAQGLRFPVAVNISARNLLDPRFPTRLTDLLGYYRVPGELLVLELTETAIMSNPGGAAEALQHLVAHGVRISIDDFGTGYSSMTYLKQLPVSELKIDRSFISAMSSQADDAVLVQSAIDLGHNLGLTVVAEGVEDQAVLQHLRTIGCDQAQGYHISRPVSADDLDAWLAVDRPSTSRAADRSVSLH